MFILGPDALYREALTSLLSQRGFEVVTSADRAEVAVVDAAGLIPGEAATLAGRLAVVLLAEPGEHTDVPAARRVSRAEGSAALFQALWGMGGDIVRERRPSYGGLTPREHEVGELVAEGMSNRSIAAKLGMQEQSVKNVVSTIMRKTKCENRTQVALKLRATFALGTA